MSAPVPSLPDCVHVVADYGCGDLAFAEVVRSLDAHFGHGLSYALASTPPFDTKANGQHLARLVKQLDGSPALVFHNVAPRRDDSESVRVANVGEDLAAAWVNNTLVVGPMSGQSWAYLAANGVTIRQVGFEGKGSQFRSRDYFPGRAAELWSLGSEALDDYPEVVLDQAVDEEPAPMLWEQPAFATSPLHPPVFAVRDSTQVPKRLPGEVVTVVDTADDYAASFCAAQIAAGGVYEQAARAHALIVIDVDSSSSETWMAKLAVGTTVIGPNRPAVWTHLLNCGAIVHHASSESPIDFAEMFIANPDEFDNLPKVNVDAEPGMNRICWIDGYGNAKFLVEAPEEINALEPGASVVVDVNGKELSANVTHASFEVPEGNLALSLEGSSGFGVNRHSFSELFLRGANFAHAAGIDRGSNDAYPTGQRIKIRIPAPTA